MLSNIKKLEFQLAALTAYALRCSALPRALLMFIGGVASVQDEAQNLVRRTQNL